MSSGIPTLPKNQSRQSTGAEDTEFENEDNPSLMLQEESDIESGGGTISETNDSEDESTAGSITSADDDESEDENEDETGGGGGGADDEEGGGGGGGGGGGDADDDENPASSAMKKKKKSTTSSGRKKNMEDDMTLLGVPHGIQFDDEEDDDDDGDDDDKDSSEYFQKLKSSVRETFIDTYHPESMSHNYDEIQTLARVVRNNAGVIVDDLHRTLPFMTKYEKTRILGQRAKQINEGSPAFIKIDSTVIDGYLIAVKELEQKKTPFIIRRPLPNGGSEYWRVQDLEIL
jgi:DNA-directed RNA polymerase I, II, and III subunit RPABC2